MLKLKLKISNIINNLTNCTYSVIAIKNNVKVDFTFRYYVLLCINMVINFFIYIKQLVESNCDKIHISRKVNGSIHHLILDENIHELLVGNIDYYINEHNIIIKTIALGNCVITNLELHNKNEIICVKKIFNKYTENKKYGHHTIKNIITFNDIMYDEETLLVVKGIDGGKMVTNRYYLSEIMDKHVNHIFNINE